MRKVIGGKLMVRCYFYCTFIIAVTTIFLWCTMDNEDLVTRSAAISVLNTVANVKFILVWTNPNIDPIMYLGKGMESFVSRNCEYINCYVTSDREFFEDLRNFDVLVFHATEISRAWMTDVPTVRAPDQKYVFASMESSDMYPICDKQFNGFFNWTWSYKLNSDGNYGYFIVRNKGGEIVGPKSVMHWERVNTMAPIDDKLKAKLNTKTLAAAWFVSNCHARNGRLEFAEQLKSELARYNLILDIYGVCGTKSCPSQYMEDCLQIVERDYYFYLSFENSFSEDYVTEKLLHPLQRFTVPVVYGGANYSRFMPEDIYLDARKLGVKELALRMADIIKNKEKYYDFFRWHHHYSFHHVDESPDSDSYCQLCALINNRELFNATSACEDFTSWWNPPDRCTT